MSCETKGDAMERLGWIVALIGAILIGNCEAKAQDVEFPAPSVYAMLWYEVENCVGEHRDMRKVKFYWVPDDNPITTTGGFHCGWRLTLQGVVREYCWGQYNILLNTIRLAKSRVGDVGVVKHEMLHALGVHDHPVRLFYVCTGRFP